MSVHPYFLAAVLGSLSFSLKNIGYILQKKAGNTLRARGEAPGFSAYLCNMTWLCGNFLPVCGGVLLVIAYMFAPVSFVMPWMGIGLVVLSFFCCFYLKEKIEPLEWVSVGLVIAGVVLCGLNTSSAPIGAAGYERVEELSLLLAGSLQPRALLFLCLANIFSGLFVFQATRRTWRTSALAWGLWAGTLGGMLCSFKSRWPSR